MTKDKKILKYQILFIILIVISIISVSYAAFSTRITGLEKGVTMAIGSGLVEINYDGGPALNAPNMYPKEEPAITKTFTLTATNTYGGMMNYHLFIVMEYNTFRSSALTYTLDSINDNDNGEVVPEITTQTGIKTGEREIFLGNGHFNITNEEDITHTYELKIYFPLIEGFDHSIDQEKEFGARIEVREGEVYPGYNEEKGVNHPVLFTGMTPVKWDGTTEINTTSDDPDWYDYDEKRWANAKSADGSYWVWIPRYAYKIETCYHTSGEDCYNLTGKEAGDVDVKFLKSTTNITEDNTTIKSTGYEAHIKDTSMHHFLHPAFQFNGDELGFWVAKFEPSVADHTSECYINPSIVNCNNINNDIKIMPNANTWRYINIANGYKASLSMRDKVYIYGWNYFELDTHMITNLEWGAVAYLSKSRYGAPDEIWNNSYTGYKTGCSGLSINASSYSECISYETELGQKASTTHNIYGIYDMSGGSWERVMGNYNNHISSSGFTISELISIQNNKLTRYHISNDDIFENVGFNYNSNIYGDHFYETSNNAYIQGSSGFIGTLYGGWYSDHSYIPYLNYDWFSNGGNYQYKEDAGIFNFRRSNGTAQSNASFRPVLTPLS